MTETESTTLASDTADQPPSRLVAEIEALGQRMALVRDRVGRIIFGQGEVIDETLITLLAGGHVLLIGVPGLGKTRLVETLGTVLGLDEKRVQFTPDLMPADILGSEILEESETGHRSFRFIQGPVFCQLLMADEINRASPRTQSALLQAMQEHTVSEAGHYHPLPAPFHVLATQNPLEQEGTYPLPEAQLDRFLMQVDIGYPERDAEREILIATTGSLSETPEQVLTGERHTVTADLPGAGIGEELPRWGRWFRQVEVTPRGGQTLMSGIAQKPLLIVDRVGKGRMAQLMSDHIWLWARGYEGGGPHAELLRRLAHWLMKEPELEENSLRAATEDNRLSVVRRSVEPNGTPVEIVTPSGKVIKVKLEEGTSGRAKALVPVSETGIYKVRDLKHTTLAAVGNLNPLEFTDINTSPARLSPLVKTTGGGVVWSQDGAPAFRRVRPGRLTAGPGWFGLVENRDYTVASVREMPMLPGLLLLLLGLGTLTLAWRAESN